MFVLDLALATTGEVSMFHNGTFESQSQQRNKGTIESIVMKE